MNMAAFAVVIAAERESDAGDDISSLAGLGARKPWLAWPMTVAMLALAGIPGTVGFIGKFQLIHALVSGDYTWLAIVLVIGSMVSLGYYLRVVAAIWMRGAAPVPAGVTAAAQAFAPIAGGSPEADDDRAPRAELGGSLDHVPASEPAPQRPLAEPELTGVAVLFGAAVVFFGIFPSPLFSLAAHAGQAISGLF